MNRWIFNSCSSSVFIFNSQSWNENTLIDFNESGGEDEHQSQTDADWHDTMIPAGALWDMKADKVHVGTQKTEQMMLASLYWSI